jgi:hypothetical protein
MMRKKMRIEQNPHTSKSESPEVKAHEPLEIAAGDFTEKLAISKSLEKIKVSLLDIQKSLNSLAA